MQKNNIWDYNYIYQVRTNKIHYLSKLNSKVSYKYNVFAIKYDFYFTILFEFEQNIVECFLKEDR